MSFEKVAFIGLGIMGRPMAINLLQAGHSVFAFARRADALKPVQDAGAQICATPKEAMAQSDFAIVIVSDTPDVEQVIFGDDGLASGAREDAVIIDMSTCDPQATRAFAAKLAERNIRMLDAPVSGGEPGAISGELSIMVGGEAEPFQRALPLFKALGKNIVHIGASGNGQVAKACNQLLITQSITATAEMFEFAESMGADAQRVREALLGGFAASRILELHGKRMLCDDYRPGFKASLLLKDLNIVADAIERLGLDLPGARLARERTERLVRNGDGELDCAALAKVVRRKESGNNAAKNK